MFSDKEVSERTCDYCGYMDCNGDCDKAQPKPLKYKHYKGGVYKYITDATLEWCRDEPNSHVIVYEDKRGNRWVRPRTEFFGFVVVDGEPVRRFEKI